METQLVMAGKNKLDPESFFFHHFYLFSEIDGVCFLLLTIWLRSWRVSGPRLVGFCLEYLMCPLK